MRHDYFGTIHGLDWTHRIPEPVYLATPYTHFKGGRKAAYRAAVEMQARFIARGFRATSPIAMGHPLQDRLNFENDRWQDYDFELLKAHKSFVICMLPGWKTSTGITLELGYALARQHLGLMSCYVYEPTLDILNNFRDLESLQRCVSQLTFRLEEHLKDERSLEERLRDWRYRDGATFWTSR